MNWLPDSLENETVRLVSLRNSDFERLFVLASDPAIWEQHPTSNRYKREVFQLYFDGAVSSGNAFLIFEQATNQLIGSTRFYDYRADVSSVAIGYTFLAKSFWGGKYNLATKQLLINHAFQHVDTIAFHIGRTNIRSQKAILKIGAVSVNEVDFEYYGENTPHFEYQISKQNWTRRFIQLT